MSNEFQREISPQEHFEACLERAARGLCQARGINPGIIQSDMKPAWRSAAEELRHAWLIAQFVRTLP